VALLKTINGNNANEAWEKAAGLLLKEKRMLNGRNGKVYELLHAFISIDNPQQKWVYSRIPPMSLGFALAELVWIINGEDDAKIINFWNSRLSKYAGNGKCYYGAYGKRMRSHFGFDQIEKAYQALQNVPESRQVVIQIYDTKTDFPVEYGKPRNMDIPCNVCSFLKIRKNRLEWSQIMRSNDVLLGLPYNFVQFMGLQEILAGWLEIQPGTYNHYSDSLHLYQKDINKIGIRKGTEIKNTDSLSLKKVESERIFKEIYIRMKALTNSNISEKDVQSLAYLHSEYEAYNNIMLIISAYVARKKKFFLLKDRIINSCTNHLYIEIWNQWEKFQERGVEYHE
jgi:thymidylate synthase